MNRWLAINVRVIAPLVIWLLAAKSGDIHLIIADCEFWGFTIHIRAYVYITFHSFAMYLPLASELCFGYLLA